ncbi:hypothetical protein LMG7053_05246 [Achromobacter ruhlandii]|uniref:Uncharacterized protein n=1 Tax=Achromobacter ruhlandii TaxID=72557 RepID=A0ABM8M258_9BURK|nr:hypothetical protein [Achromobacter ruhlandii]AOU95869.1 uncharacterized protein AruCF_4978 [Achromobacter ruhlandii]CAB3957296.1 hypothetical protein LMG7053_05246 [Achromobacter ruhlandii]
MNFTQEDHAFVEFYMDPVELTYETEAQGHPVYKEVEHIKIMTPGDPHNIIERRATDADKVKYPRAWERFLRTEHTAHDGLPLEQWPQINRAQVKEAKYFEVHTVEQMSGLADSHLGKMPPGFRELRSKAQAYLKAANDTAAATAQAAEAERLRAEVADVRAQLAEMQKQYGEPAKRGPGRPPKAE